MEGKTKGQVEAQVSEAIIKFEKEYLGRGPRETKTYILQNMVFIRLEGVLTPAEEQLAKNAEGAGLIKQTRVLLLENAREYLQRLIHDITGLQVVSMHTDISTKTGERIIIFVLDRDLEKTFA
jgi:uncharacterized protein YbcI